MNTDLKELLREVLIGQGGLAEAVAQEAGVAYATVYAQAVGNNNPSIAVVKAAYIVTRDNRLKNHLTPRGYKLVRTDDLCRSTKAVESEAMDLHIRVGRLIETYREASRDGRYTADERVALMREIADTRVELAELEAAITRDMEAGSA